jgi:hypothetical protein
MVLPSPNVSVTVVLYTPGTRFEETGVTVTTAGVVPEVSDTFSHVSAAATVSERLDSAVTVKLPGMAAEVPAVDTRDRLTGETCAAAARTKTVFEVPVISGNAVSLPVMVCEPGVRKVATKVPLPCSRPTVCGNTACGSLLVRVTLP